MKEIKLTRVKHNGLKGYKDETRLFFVVKGWDQKFRLFQALPSDSKNVNELRAWGYEEINSNWTFKTLKDVKMQIASEIEDGIWFDDFQRNLKNEYYFGVGGK